MADPLADAKQRLKGPVDQCGQLNLEPITADQWVVSSLLQKSIRRGEPEIAQRAALTLFKLRGSAIWRRLMVIAFEDVGIGSLDALTMTVAACSDAAWRKTSGGDVLIAAHIAGALADAPKDRSADYLCSAKDHPALADFPHAMTKASRVALDHEASAAMFSDSNKRTAR